MRLRCLPALAVVAAGLTACGESGSDVGTGPPVSAADGLTLAAADGTWFVTAYSVDGQSATPDIDATAVVDLDVSTFTLGHGGLRARSLLNYAQYRRRPGLRWLHHSWPVTFGVRCGTPGERRGDPAALEGVTSFRLNGDDLELVGPTTTATLSPAG
ncbi:MAG: hypothetical protein R2706_13505 [Acidimicrobiales bacterium]